MKLSPLAILFIGIMFGVIGLAFGYFQHFAPNMRDADTYNTWGEKLDAEAAKMPDAVKRVNDAKELVEQTSDKWQETVARKTPPSSVAAGGINVAVNPYDLTVDARTFRNNVQRAVNSQLKSGGVTVVQGPEVPMPPDDPETIMASYFNYPGSQYPVAIYDLGQVTVRGSFSQISENIRAWSRMPNYLAVADALVITGTAPDLTASYNVTLVAFVRGKKIGAPIEMARAQAGGGAAGGATGAASIPPPPSGGGSGAPVLEGDTSGR